MSLYPNMPMGTNSELRSSHRQCTFVATVACAILFLAPQTVFPQTVTINTPMGPVKIDVSHLGPDGDLVSASDPEPASFRPPQIFSVPLPSGSGARALGSAGAFTALADDATSASWNPGGLVQLEEPEFSFVLHVTDESQTHFSDDSFFMVGDNEFSDVQLNYLSLVVPFRASGRNWSFSANYQKAYDFANRFTADLRSVTSTHETRMDKDEYSSTHTQFFQDSQSEMTLVTRKDTTIRTTLDQLQSQDLASSLSFEQEGVIDALSHAVAVELTPRISLGATLNAYQSGVITDSPIRATTTARYSGTSHSHVESTSTRSTGTSYSYDGVAHIELGGPNPITIDVPFSGADTLPTITDTSSSVTDETLMIDGTYSEINEFRNLHGYNATLGAIVTVSRHLSLGATVDLPWSAETTQTRTIRNTINTLDPTGTMVLDTSARRQRAPSSTCISPSTGHAAQLSAGPPNSTRCWMSATRSGPTSTTKRAA